MSGWTTRPRKVERAGCVGCRQERGAVVQALSARIGRVGGIWLCAGCAVDPAHRQAFIGKYAWRIGVASLYRRPDALP